MTVSESPIVVTPNSCSSRSPLNSDDKQRFKIQQEYFRKNSPSSPVKTPALLRQPRKSLAMVFSHISKNLGFQKAPSMQRSESRDSSNGSCSSSSSGAFERHHHQQEQQQMDHLTVAGNESARNPTLTSLAHSKLIKNRRGNPTIIQLGKNNEIFVPNGELNPSDRSTRTTSITGTLGLLEARSHDPTPARLTTISTDSGGGQKPTMVESRMERSLTVDLLSTCTCCCSRSEDDEHYANLIENHRLARIITMVAALIIAGLIIAYIINSAMETNPTTEKRELKTNVRFRQSTTIGSLRQRWTTTSRPVLSTAFSVNQFINRTDNGSLPLV